MSIILVEGCGPHYYDCATEGNSEDFSFIGEDLFPGEAVTANWQSSNCIITNVIVENGKAIEGRNYDNVVTARISGLVSGVTAETNLQLTGQSTTQNKHILLNIRVT